MSFPLRPPAPAPPVARAGAGLDGAPVPAPAPAAGAGAAAAADVADCSRFEGFPILSPFQSTISSPRMMISLDISLSCSEVRY
jgi:hypothetical protein